MKILANIFALIGLWATTMVGFFWIGYATYEPKCRTIVAMFTEHCK
jgi:hypothetical protein